jgi:hypothetical protein
MLLVCSVILFPISPLTLIFRFLICSVIQRRRRWRRRRRRLRRSVECFLISLLTRLLICSVVVLHTYSHMI